MAKIIPLLFGAESLAGLASCKQRTTTNYLVEAAWKFAYSTLWHEQTFSAAELKSARKHLLAYFQDSTDLQQAFVQFCERVLLANRYLAGEKSRYVPNPSLWLNSRYAYGFAGTLSWYHQLVAQREKIKGYQEGIAVAAQHYWNYLTAPTNKAFVECRKKLLQLREYGLLQIFYNAIIYLNFLSA